MVVGVISLGALTVAIFAVSRADDSSGTGRVVALERSLNRRLDVMNRRLEDINRRAGGEKSDLARADRRERMDVAGLAGRLQVVENSSVKTVKAAADANRRLSALTTRIDSLAEKANRRPK